MLFFSSNISCFFPFIYIKIRFCISFLILIHCKLKRKKLSKHACRLSAMPYICRAEYIPLFSTRKLSELQSNLFYLFSMKNIVHNNVRSLYIPYECNPFVGRRLLIKMEMLFRQQQHRANAKFCLTISIRIWSVLITHGSYLEKKIILHVLYKHINNELNNCKF